MRARKNVSDDIALDCATHAYVRAHGSARCWPQVEEVTAAARELTAQVLARGENLEVLCEKAEQLLQAVRAARERGRPSGRSGKRVQLTVYRAGCSR